MVSITLFGMILIMKYVSLIKSTHKDLFFDKKELVKSDSLFIYSKGG